MKCIKTIVSLYGPRIRALEGWIKGMVGVGSGYSFGWVTLHMKGIFSRGEFVIPGISSFSKGQASPGPASSQVPEHCACSVTSV